MRGLFQALFYLWVVGSVIALVLYRRRKRAEATAQPSEGSATTVRGLTGVGAPRATDPATPQDLVTPTIPRARPAADLAPSAGDPAAPRSGDDHPWDDDRAVLGSSGAGSSDAGPSGTGSSDARTTPAGAGRTGLFAPTGAAAVPAATVAEALGDVAWPCGLTPVVLLEDLHQADRRVVFSTTDASAPEVGSRVGDALEAAGFSLTSLDDVNVVARRPGATVALRLHPTAEKATRDGRPLFPTLPADSVVLVCDLRAD